MCGCERAQIPRKGRNLLRPDQETAPTDAFKVSRFRQHPSPTPSQGIITKGGLRYFMTLKQACLSEYQEAQGAFKDSMIH